MKRLILTTSGIGILALTLSSFSVAKVSDFNSLIDENISAQQELHGEIKKQMNTTSQAFQKTRSHETSQTASVLVDEASDQINTPTNNKILRYKKEKNQKSISEKKQLDRISQEFNEVEEAL